MGLAGLNVNVPGTSSDAIASPVPGMFFNNVVGTCNRVEVNSVELQL